VEQQSDLSGGNWVVSATYLKGVGLVRRNNEFHHFDVVGTAGVITDASGAVLSTNVYDAFGVARYISGNAQTQWRWLQAEEEGLVHGGGRDFLPQWGVVLQQKGRGIDADLCQKEYDICMKLADSWWTTVQIVLGMICTGGGVINVACKCFGLCSRFITPPAIAGCQLACMVIIGVGCGLAWTILHNQYRARMEKCKDDYAKCMSPIKNKN